MSVVNELRDFARSIVPGAEVWPPDVVRDIVTRAADLIEHLEGEITRMKDDHDDEMREYGEAADRA